MPRLDIGIPVVVQDRARPQSGRDTHPGIITQVISEDLGIVAVRVLTENGVDYGIRDLNYMHGPGHIEGLSWRHVGDPKVPTPQTSGDEDGTFEADDLDIDLNAPAPAAEPAPAAPAADAGTAVDPAPAAAPAADAKPVDPAPGADPFADLGADLTAKAADAAETKPAATTAAKPAEAVKK